jgi:hypothetical protein
MKYRIFVCVFGGGGGVIRITVNRYLLHTQTRKLLELWLVQDLEIM